MVARISLEHMEQLLDFDASQHELLDFDENSYGVQNIHRRIQLICGLQYGLSYFIRGGRTYCDIRLPIQKKRKRHLRKRKIVPTIQKINQKRKSEVYRTRQHRFR